MALRERKARVGAIPEGGMADIAFLLLVFFLVTTTIDMDKGLGIILPAEGQEVEINMIFDFQCDFSLSLYSNFEKYHREHRKAKKTTTHN